MMGKSRKIAYQSSLEVERKPLKNKLYFDTKSQSSTENAGRNGINLQEYAQDSDGVNPDDIYEESLGSEDPEISDVINLLEELYDYTEDEIYVRSFSRYLLLKFAEAEETMHSDLFNDLILKINNTDSPDKNTVIKKITNIYSRTVMLEYEQNNDMDKAKSIAYDKVLHRANQYLFSGKMLKATANLQKNPRLVAGNIKNIIDSLVSGFKPDARLRSYPNLRRKIKQLNVQDLASKRSPGGAAIGTAINITKNILKGRDPAFIVAVKEHLDQLLSQAS